MLVNAVAADTMVILQQSINIHYVDPLSVVRHKYHSRRLMIKLSGVFDTTKFQDI